MELFTRLLLCFPALLAALPVIAVLAAILNAVCRDLDQAEAAAQWHASQDRKRKRRARRQRIFKAAKDLL